MARILAAAFSAVLVMGGAAEAQKVNVQASYEISLAGWGIAKSTLDLKINGRRYEASLFMKPKGVARIVTAVRTTVSASGEVRKGRVLPARYRVRAEEIKRPVAVDMSMRGGNVSKVSARPPLKKRKGRVNITRAHRRGVVDPFSSGLIPIRSADGRDACDRTLEIYDGWTRYNVRLAFKGMRRVKTKGFSGKVAVCAARWVPVAGHRPAKKEVQYLKNNRDLEVTVMALPGGRYGIPYSVSIGTPNGKIRVEPSRFNISAAGV
ncbi:MAG: DUF3108 domain-containing protein [Pseudomonadota bacterium]